MGSMNGMDTIHVFKQYLPFQTWEMPITFKNKNQSILWMAFSQMAWFPIDQGTSVAVVANTFSRVLSDKFN